MPNGKASFSILEPAKPAFSVLEENKALRSTIDSTIDEVVDFGFNRDDNFRSLMKETAAHEAHFGKLDPVNPMRVDDITYRNFEQEPKIMPLFKALGAKIVDGKLDRKDLKTNVITAAMKYNWNDKVPEGSRGFRASSSQTKRAQQWKDIYNTEAGKGTPEKFLKSQEIFDMREKEREKGLGFLGKLSRPDGGFSTELSIGINFDGKEREIPLLVPTLEQKEIDYLLEGNEATRPIINKAIKHARERIKSGKDPFAQKGEQGVKHKAPDQQSSLIDFILPAASAADQGSFSILQEGKKKQRFFLEEAKGEPFAREVLTPEQKFLQRIEPAVELIGKTGFLGEKELAERKKGQRRERIFQRALLPVTFVAGGVLPASFVLGIEAVNQLKNVIVTAVKKEKFDPVEIKTLSSLLPADTPTPLKIVAGITEVVGDILVVGGLLSLAKQGLLKASLKEVGTKLSAAGYGEGKITITREAIKRATRGSTLEREIARFAKSKGLQVPAATGRQAPPTAPTGAPEPVFKQPSVISQPVREPAFDPAFAGPRAGGLPMTEVPAYIKKVMEKGVEITSREAPILMDKAIQVKDIHGNKVTLPKGEEYTPFKLSNGKVWLHDGKNIVIDKNQLSQVKGLGTELKAFETPEEQQTTEIVKGDETRNYTIDDIEYQGIEKRGGAEFHIVKVPDNVLQLPVTQYPTRTAAIERALQKTQGFDKTKFSQYQLPGGTNYKETLITVPVKTKESSGMVGYRKEGARKDDISEKSFKTYTEAKEFFESLPSERRIVVQPTSVPGKIIDFTSPHWSEPNVIAHIRTNERTGPKGEKILFIEELQSDWADSGRQKGFATDISESEKTKIFKENQESREVIFNKLRNLDSLGFDSVGQAVNAVMAHEDYVKRWDLGNEPELIKAVDRYKEAIKKVDSITQGVPSHPLLKNWKELALKKVIKQAIDGGYDTISWTTGEQQADRYDLSKQVEKIQWVEVSEGKHIEIVPIDKNIIPILIDNSGKITKVTGDGDRSWVGKNLSDVIGKDIAQKILDRKEGDLKSQDLKIGGEGKRVIYDVQIPSILKKLTGGDVGQINISGTLKGFPTFTKDRVTIQQSLTLTPQVKAKIFGQPKAGGLPIRKEPEDPKGIVEAGGGVFRGVSASLPAAGGQPAIPGIVQFDDPETGTTLAMKENELTTEGVRKKIAKSRADFAVEAKPPAGEPPEKIPPSDVAGAEGPEGEGAEVLAAYEKQKDIWIGNKDVRVLQSKIEKRALQKELPGALGKEKYDVDVEKYDKAMQIYVDTKRNPEHIKKYWDKLTKEQQETVTLSQNLPENVRAIADKISASYKEIGLEAQDIGIIRNVLDNYAARVWRIEGKSGSEKFRKFATTTRHAKTRRLGTIIEGWASGLELKVEGATNNLQILKEEIVKTIEDKNFLNALKKIRTVHGEPLLSTQQLEGYVKVEHPNFKVWRHAGFAPETEATGKVFGKNFFRDEEGRLWERRDLYAPKDQAKNLNNILGISKLKGIPVIDFVTKYNAVFKAWILQSSFFHHLAFTRSYWLGTQHKLWNEMSIRQAYRQGIKAIEDQSPIVMLGVRNGLTLGLKQDWDEEILREKSKLDNYLDKIKVIGPIKNKVLDLRQKHVDFLFGELGAGLKAKAFMIEFRNLTKQHPDKLADELAKMAANLINDDFGGLHLQRLGRNPTIQHIFRIFALAPDWTESNVRTMVKSFKAGSKEETNFYRTFWAGIFTKAAMVTVLGNALMAGMDEDDKDARGWYRRMIRNYKRAWKEGKLRWADIDITPIYRGLGGATKNRKYFSVFGHFKDPIKFITHPIRSAKHKGSVVYGIFHEALTGVDWAGRRFTTTSEILGVDKEKGRYKTTRKGFYKKGDPKWGKLKWKTVTWDFRGKGPLSYNQIIPFAISQVKGVAPVQIQNLISWMSGEMEGFDALLKSAGLRVSTTYEKPEKGKQKWKVSKKKKKKRRKWTVAK